MSRKIKSMFWIICSVMLLTACQSQEAPKSIQISEVQSNEVTESEVALESPSDENNSTSSEMIEITEKMYVTYINEMYTNTEKYLGKTIKLEGMFTSAYEESTGETYYFVYRTGPGCCGNDGSMCGFEFTTTGEIAQENDWIEVAGTLDEYEQDGYIYLTLRDSTVTVKEERGQEVVYQ